MSIKIYTYSDPYKISKEDFWDEIKGCPHFCVSQEMVNGLSSVYPSLKEMSVLSTMRKLINTLYSNWEDVNTRVKQIMTVSNTINYMKFDDEENIKRSLDFNTKSLVSCIRLFKELDLKPDEIDTTNLNRDQQILVDIYKNISKRQYSPFNFKHIKDEEEIDNAIKKTLSQKNPEISFDRINMNSIVIHGIHQFTPAMLCAIEDISTFKEVILIFNYQEQYKAVYQTWLNIYSLFHTRIISKSSVEFKPSPMMTNSYASNILADSMGKLANGNLEAYNPALNDLEVIEFANLTEFADYSANLFDKAQRLHKDLKQNAPVLTYMSEQMYSASGKVNDILRAYFPEQFGERHFLDYPIGHFFVAITCMWDVENEQVKIDSMSDLKECLSSGIICEDKNGQLLNTFNRIESFIEKENTLEGIISKVKKLKKYVNPDPCYKLERRIGYYDVTKDEIKSLLEALKELNEIIKNFFGDFNEGDDNFQRFYKKIHDFIVGKKDDMEDLDEEMKDVINRLLQRIENQNLPETGTYNCLKQTMEFYLSQNENLAKGASWIVRDFEQIDGDILRSIGQKPDKTCYHFCCLSDKDLCSSKNEKLPWPLDINFFEYSYEPLDWKYQIFLKSKMEFSNFKRYALLYGLDFNRISCKLSYVKAENRKDNDLYHILSLLGIKIIKYRSEANNTYVPYLKYTTNDYIDDYSSNEVDTVKYNLCPYRFALETVVQDRTIFRDRFLIIHYIRILLSNTVQIKLSGAKYSNELLRKTLNEVFDDLKTKFQITNEVEKTQIIAAVYASIRNYNSKHQNFATISNKREFSLSEDFLLTEIKNANRTNIDDKLKKKINSTEHYPLQLGKHCTYCASKDICLHAKNEQY